MSRYWIFVATAAGLTLFLIALGAVPTSRLAGPGGLKALVVGCCLGFAACAISVLPVVLVKAAPGNTVSLALAATAIRLGVTGVATVLLVLISGLPSSPLLIWTGIGYLAMLPLETRFMLRFAERHSEPKPMETS